MIGLLSASIASELSVALGSVALAAVVVIAGGWFYLRALVKSCKVS